MKTFYHISRFDDPLIDVFVPRVPTNRSGGEDEKTPRICVSPSVEGCMRAHSTILYYLLDFFEHEYACPYEHMAQFHQLLEHGKNGMLFRVYHFGEAGLRMKTADELIDECLVPDVYATKEHWVLDSTSPTTISYLLIYSVEKKEEVYGYDWKYELFDRLEDIGEVMNYHDYHTMFSDGLPALDEKKYTKEEAVKLNCEAIDLFEKKEVKEDNHGL